jgi:hypothetical protein
VETADGDAAIGLEPRDVAPGDVPPHPATSVRDTTATTVNDGTILDLIAVGSTTSGLVSSVDVLNSNPGQVNRREGKRL